MFLSPYTFISNIRKDFNVLTKTFKDYGIIIFFLIDKLILHSFILHSFMVLHHCVEQGLLVYISKNKNKTNKKQSLVLTLC